MKNLQEEMIFLCGIDRSIGIAHCHHVPTAPLLFKFHSNEELFCVRSYSSVPEPSRRIREASSLSLSVCCQQHIHPCALSHSPSSCAMMSSGVVAHMSEAKCRPSSQSTTARRSRYSRQKLVRNRKKDS